MNLTNFLFIFFLWIFDKKIMFFFLWIRNLVISYVIGHAETAHNRIASVVLGFKEALLEEAEKKKDKQK